MSLDVYRAGKNRGSEGYGAIIFLSSKKRKGNKEKKKKFKSRN